MSEKTLYISQFGILLLMTFFTAKCQKIIYMKNEGGIYTIPCEVNGLKLRFIFDTGASNVCISLTEAIFMLKNDYLDEDDIRGTSYAQIANGEITENTTVLLKEINIDGIKLYNVSAIIMHDLDAPLLLGQSAIEKLGSIIMDGNKLTIVNRTSEVPSSTNKSKEDIVEYSDIGECVTKIG